MARMDLSLFDEFTQSRFDVARKLAESSGAAAVECGHLLLVDLRPDDRGLSVLRPLVGDRADELRERLSALLDAQPRAERSTVRSSEVKTIVDAFQRGYDPGEHNLDDVVERWKGTESAVAGWKDLVAACVEFFPSTIRSLTLTFGLSGEKLQGMTPAMSAAAGIGLSASGGSFLDTITTDLTALAAEGRLAPVVGRESELRRLMTVLGRVEINNPILLGEPGVGKTRIVEALARRIADGRVDERLRGKRLLSLDLGTLVAGTGYRGQFEERVKQLVDEVAASDGRILLFIDEIHQMLGLGKSGGTMDAANLLKPAMSRGLLRIIGATTYAEYRHIESDPAFRRRFATVDVPEQSMADVEEILTQVAPVFEAHHGVTFPPDTLRAAVRMARRYLGDVRSPAREIGLIDELGSELSIGKAEEPEPSDDLRTQPEAASSSGTGGLDAVRTELPGTSETDVATAPDEAVSVQDLADHPPGESPVRPPVDGAATANPAADASSDAGAPRVVSVADVASLIGRQTGIPVDKLTGDRRRRVAELDRILLDRVFGQEEAVRATVEAVQRSMAGLGHPSRPRAILFYAGPSGVGKTELAKAVTAELFDSESNMVRLDMSEFSAETARNRLVGSDPGYVGYEEGGRLTEAVRRRPYSLVLLDEFEKAHPSVWRIFLQVFDDGRLTDSQGRTVNFADTVIIMTSNAGALLLSKVDELREELDGLGADATPEAVDAALQRIVRTMPGSAPSAYSVLTDVARAHLDPENHELPTAEQVVREALLAIPGFPPELFSRIGRPIVFDTLKSESLYWILTGLLRDLTARLAVARRSTQLPASVEAKDLVGFEKTEEGLVAFWDAPESEELRILLRTETMTELLERGYDPLIGARALRNAFEGSISTRIAAQVLSQDLNGPLRIEL